MIALKKFVKLVDNYVLARLQNRPSTAQFWYLPEPAVVTTQEIFQQYKNPQGPSPFYFMDYRAKLQYTLTNSESIIVLPYDQPIGQQVNPEAAFQFALGLHDMHYHTQEQNYLSHFFNYANYFLARQTTTGLWNYEFDWFAAKKPWSSALAQARGASVMLRAWLHSNDSRYRDAACKALDKFAVSTKEQGFLHIFAPEACPYFEEYPEIPTGVINGFMAALMSIWELHYWLQEDWLQDLWQQGMTSLARMLPYYTTGWWSLYDLDAKTPVPNVNSPRYHLLEINYLKVLSVLSSSAILGQEHDQRVRQSQKRLSRYRALGLKVIRKTLYK